MTLDFPPSELRLLVTTSSFLDTPGPHHQALKDLGAIMVKVRGPLSSTSLLELVQQEGPFDGCIAGEDQFTSSVISACLPRLKVISRFGVGLDKIDIESAEAGNVRVFTTAGSNHTTVTEHTFGLLLSLLRHIPEHNELMHAAQWRRLTGVELAGKTLGVLGFGRVGREVAKRALAFGMKVLVHNTSWSIEHQEYVDMLNGVFAHDIFQEFPTSIGRIQNVEEVLAQCDILTLHMNLTKHNLHFLNARKLHKCKRGVIIVNVSRGGLVDQRVLADALRAGHVAGYAADVVDPEPVESANPLLGLPYVHLTPHVGSRTVDSVIRQGIAAVEHLKEGLGMMNSSPSFDAERQDKYKDF
jgi:D-3-phosphoglycerate dehydrogenase / 2-oxoglutarate reductase